MTAGRTRRNRLCRRQVLGLAAGYALLPVLPALAQEQPPEPSSAAPPVLTVSRARVLKEAHAARTLQEAEDALTADLQSQYDKLKEAFNAEEKQLTALRRTLPREEFEQRVGDFDRRVRIVRRRTQERADEMQKKFQSARLELVRLLGPVIERLRAERGAQVVLNRDDVLAADPSIDITADVVALFDEMVPDPVVPEFEPIDLEAEAADTGN